MTTIAFTKGELAFDSRITAGSDIVGSMIKGKRLESGALIAICGDVAQGQLFQRWAEDGFVNNDTKKTLELLKDADYTAVVILPDSSIRVHDNNLLPIVYTSKMYAWGSGGPFALGAMVHGASAAEAVKVAKICDACTGGRVRVLRLEEACKKKPKKRS